MFSDDWLDDLLEFFLAFLMVTYLGWCFWTGIFYIYDHLTWSW